MGRAGAARGSPHRVPGDRRLRCHCFDAAHCMLMSGDSVISGCAAVRRSDPRVRAPPRWLPFIITVSQPHHQTVLLVERCEFTFYKYGMADCSCCLPSASIFESARLVFKVTIPGFSSAHWSLLPPRCDWEQLQLTGVKQMERGEGLEWRGHGGQGLHPQSGHSSTRAHSDVYL